MAPREQNRVRRTTALLLSGAALLSYQAAKTFIAPGRTAGSLRTNSIVARHADDKDEGGGFMSFLKVEQDIVLTQEEYQVALDAEIEAQRKKYYIGGEVKKNNLIVPWKPVDEQGLSKDARKTLRKNGIKDPMGVADDDEGDSAITLSVIGEQDVKVEWTAGVPGQKVGYIVEKKRVTDANFQEIASYEQQANSYLLAKDYPGHDYSFLDDIVEPNSYTYRILYRVRSGEVTVVDQADVTVREIEGLGFFPSLGIFGGLTFLLFLVSYLADPPIS